MKRLILLVGISVMLLSTYGQDFEVSPLKLFFSAEPGETQTKYFFIKNHSNNIETFILKLGDYSVDSKGIGAFEESGSLKNSIANIISVAPSFFELQPNEGIEVAVSIQQPLSEYGSKWGVVFVSTAQEQTTYSVDKSVSAGVNISSRIVVDIYQTPQSNTSYKSTISNLKEIESKNDSIRVFLAIVNNLEDIITKAKVYLIATEINSFEETVFSAINFDMYPKSSRKLELSMPNTLPKGTYSLAAILDYGSRTNLEGTQMIIKIE